MPASNGALCVKSGAEGMICLAVPDAGYGITIRVADGSYRAHPVIVCAVLRQLDLVPVSVTEAILEHFSPVITNHNGVPVGEIRAAFRLTT